MDASFCMGCSPYRHSQRELIPILAQKPDSYHLGFHLFSFCSRLSMLGTTCQRGGSEAAEHCLAPRYGQSKSLMSTDPEKHDAHPGDELGSPPPHPDRSKLAAVPFKADRLERSNLEIAASEIRRLQREVEYLRRQREILKSHEHSLRRPRERRAMITAMLRGSTGWRRARTCNAP